MSIRMSIMTGSGSKLFILGQEVPFEKLKIATVREAGPMAVGGPLISISVFCTLMSGPFIPKGIGASRLVFSNEYGDEKVIDFKNVYLASTNLEFEITSTSIPYELVFFANLA